jgi:hypothetical protein
MCCRPDEVEVSALLIVATFPDGFTSQRQCHVTTSSLHPIRRLVRDTRRGGTTQNYMFPILILASSFSRFFHIFIFIKTPDTHSCTFSVPRTELIGDPDRYVKAGSTVIFRCVVRGALEQPSYIIWYHGSLQIYVENRHGLKVQFERDVEGETHSSVSGRAERASRPLNFTSRPDGVEREKKKGLMADECLVRGGKSLRPERACRYSINSFIHVQLYSLSLTHGLRPPFSAVDSCPSNR